MSFWDPTGNTLTDTLTITSTKWYISYENAHLKQTPRSNCMCYKFCHTSKPNSLRASTRKYHIISSASFSFPVRMSLGRMFWAGWAALECIHSGITVLWTPPSNICFVFQVQTMQEAILYSLSLCGCDFLPSPVAPAAGHKADRHCTN